MPFPTTSQLNKEQDMELLVHGEFPGSQQCAPSIHEKVFGFETKSKVDLVKIKAVFWIILVKLM